MAKGKKTCKILKDIRKQIAEENDIELVTSECTYKGDCEGTCPKCEAELRYLERELEKRQRMGKVAVLAGISIGTMLSVSSCDVIRPPLAGDVVCIDTVQPAEDPDTTPIEEPLMGIVPVEVPDTNVVPEEKELDALVGDPFDEDFENENNPINQ